MLKQWAFVLVFVEFFIAFASLSYAQNISVSYDYSAIAGVNFSFSLELVNFSADTYDIKIDITNSTGSRISRIYDNGTWKSTNFYIVKAINLSEASRANFSLNTTEDYTGVANITIKIRNSQNNNDMETFVGYFLNVTPKTETQINSSQNSTNQSAQNNTGTAQTPASSGNTTQTTSVIEESEGISLKFPTNVSVSEIFNVTVKMFNLKNKPYDLKVELRIGETLVSEVYNERDKEWQSSFYYLQNFTESNGNQMRNVSLRLKNNVVKSDRDAILSVKLRRSGTQISSKSEDIKITYADKTAGEKYLNETTNETITKIEDNKIYLNKKEETQGIKSTPYRSFKEFVREYAIYGFAILSIFLIIILKDERENTGENNN
ncbi:MAG: hypothetical protein AABX65_02250 [Nanoarchaeota archaeon]